MKRLVYCQYGQYIVPVSLRRWANARNVRLYYPYRHYTNLFNWKYYGTFVYMCYKCANGVTLKNISFQPCKLANVTSSRYQNWYWLHGMAEILKNNVPDNATYTHQPSHQPKFVTSSISMHIKVERIIYIYIFIYTALQGLLSILF